MFHCRIFKHLIDKMSDKELQMFLNAIADERSKRAFKNNCRRM
jgi:hypothetical protein